ncbi:hypothetical protein QQS21_006117 [Conoideocrella luteorostrata]|uniref:Methyltransferase type 11 domain-containing protein n=1 Tax=Conoideocrella luteorostrata TaxID=1105319 RepID=A0AAJ0FTR3_9HYPO|nr:hypothetical protein QQS21_006117 [Conoideocrella luteorostrata]
MSKDQNNYSSGYKAHHIRHHEWRTAENSAQNLIPILISLAKTNPNLTMLDVGTGCGTITTSLAKYMPQGRVTAVDLSPHVLSRARSLAADNAAASPAHSAVNVTFQQADAYELPFADSTFDVVHSAHMLTHLDEPWDALREMLRVTKPGGVVSVRDADMQLTSYYPELPGLLHFQELICKVMEEVSGGSAKGGRKLVSWAMRAGVRRDQIVATMSGWAYSTPEERAMISETFCDRLTIGSVGKTLLEKGLATPEQINEMVQALRAWCAQEDAFWGMAVGEVTISKTVTA